jgi:hypothetical protein
MIIVLSSLGSSSPRFDLPSNTVSHIVKSSIFNNTNVRASKSCTILSCTQHIVTDTITSHHLNSPAELQCYVCLSTCCAHVLICSACQHCSTNQITIYTYNIKNMMYQAQLYYRFCVSIRTTCFKLHIRHFQACTIPKSPYWGRQCGSTSSD